jgi:hypothetical protein
VNKKIFRTELEAIPTSALVSRDGTATSMSPLAARARARAAKAARDRCCDGHLPCRTGCAMRGGVPSRIAAAAVAAAVASACSTQAAHTHDGGPGGADAIDGPSLTVGDGPGSGAADDGRRLPPDGGRDGADSANEGSFRACAEGLVAGGPCGAALLPCHAPPASTFSCRPRLCLCESGRVRCDDTQPGSAAGARECLPAWTCVAEGIRFPSCNSEKPWTQCRCTAEGGWLCEDECKRMGCPEGPYFGTGPSLLRPHTGDACNATGPCPYQTTVSPITVVTCTCVSGRFQCSDEPARDGGAPDAPAGG